MRPKVYLGIPSYDGRIHEGILNAVLGSSKEALDKIHIESSSWITKNFNTLYAGALNERKNGVTHFCMMHEDISVQRPVQGPWLDALLSIMDRVKADVLSVISPIKSPDGLSSTALDESPNPKLDSHWRVRRLTMSEIHNDYPMTFTHDKLLVNTGLMLVNIQNDWADKLWFEFEDKIIHHPEDNKFVSVGVPEDWNFSRKAKALGAKIYATREIALIHHGTAKYTNATPWGRLKTDSVL